MDTKELKSSITDEHVVSIMEDLGATCRLNSGKLTFNTICHGGHSHKLYYYGEGNFHCYTECGHIDIIELVCRVKEIDFVEALQYICNKVGVNYNSNQRKKGFTLEKTTDWDAIRKYKLLMNRNRDVEDLPIHDKCVLNAFSDLYYQPWIDEGITIETMQKYGIKYCSSRNRIIIPHYNMNNELIGIKGRALTDSEIEAGFKYMPINVQGIDYSFPQNLNLYGLNMNHTAIRKQKRVVIVEAEKSVMQADVWYGEDSVFVATSNGNISQQQKHMLLSLGIIQLTIAYDKEYTELDLQNNTGEYVKYCDKLLKLAHMFTPYIKVFIVHDIFNKTELKDSPTDKGQEVFEFLYTNKVEIKTKE